MAQNYSLTDKIAALDTLAAHNEDLNAASDACGVSVKTLRKWQQQEATIRQQQAQRSILLARQQMADKALNLVQAIDGEMIAKAPLNQIASALGVLVDRYLKLEDAVPDDDTEKVVRFEYFYDGSTHVAPPWANPDYRSDEPLQGGRVRSPLRQDGAGTDLVNGKSRSAWDEDLVAGPDLSDGDPGLARLEDGPDEPRRDWSD